MNGTICLMCKSKTNWEKYDIDRDCTKHSHLLLRTFLENVFRRKLVQTVPVLVCTKCLYLLNKLDAAEIVYKTLRQKVLDSLEFANDSSFNEHCGPTVPKLDLQSKTNDNEIKDYKPHNNSRNGLKNKNSRKYECPLCFKKFIAKYYLDVHLKKRHDLDGFDIDEELPLQEESQTGTDIKEDISEPASMSINVDVPCYDKKSDESDDEADMKMHTVTRGRKKKHPDVLKPYKCSICSKTWKTLSELKSHLLAHSSTRLYICEICGQSYKHKTALDVHVGMHNGIYPFMCMYCKKSFTQKGALQRHLPLHTGETPYQCDLCGKRFVHHTSFNIHQLSHSGKKDYKCPQCGLALLSGSHLKRHMRVHTGERNYVCPTCGKRFAERYNLVSHQKLHENPSSSGAFKRNHRCQVCGTTFDRRLKLDEHMIKKHQKMNETDVPLLQQLLQKNEVDTLWTASYSNLKAEMPETSY